ncbi:MAG: glycosyltransferase [Butyrivibrio sp.]|nr:glycosyltransferase [Butyrivibrio sp.]
MKLNINTINNPIIDILVAVAARGGGENCINMVGRYLCGKGFRVRVVQMVYEGMDWAEDCMEFHYVYPSREDHDLHDFIGGYTDFLKENEKPNLVLATAWPMMSYVARRSLNDCGAQATVASWLHAPLDMYEASGFGDGDFIKYADIHFAISNEIAGAIRKADPEGLIYRINNPADLSKVHVVNENKPGTLLFVGRLSEEKNIGIILCAIAVTETNWKLRLVGEGDEKKKLVKLAKELGVEKKVEFVGWSDDPWKYADGCYGLVLSSMYEGSPLVAIEAMSCGLPVIANVSSRVNEIIKPGKNGFIYEDNDPRGLAKILDMISRGQFEPTDPAYCRERVADYEAQIALFDFYVKLFATVNKRTLVQYADRNDDYIIKDGIDVVIPCYNVEKYISRCLDSILAQTIGFDRIKIIAVNDASTDNTLDILKEYEEKYPDNICIVDCEANSGPGYCRNLGIEYVTEKYFTFIDSDDCVSKDLLERMYLLAKCYPADVVSCDFEVFENDVPVLEQQESSVSEITAVENDLERRQLFADNALLNPAWGKLYRTEFFREHQDLRFPENVKMEDIYFTYMLVAYAGVWIHLKQKLYCYYQNDEGIMKSPKSRNYYMDFHKVLEMTVDKYKELGIFNLVSHELAYAYYIKSFRNILTYMAGTFEKMPEDDVKTIVSYMNRTFPGIMENEYLTPEEKDELKYLLG